MTIMPLVEIVGGIILALLAISIIVGSMLLIAKFFQWILEL